MRSADGWPGQPACRQREASALHPWRSGVAEGKRNFYLHDLITVIS